MRQQTSILTPTEAKALEKKLVNIRILGCLLVFGSTDTVREHIAKAVLTDKNRGSDALVSRGVFYGQLFLCTCKVSLFHHLKDQTKTLLVCKSNVVPPKFLLGLRVVGTLLFDRPCNLGECGYVGRP